MMQELQIQNRLLEFLRAEIFSPQTVVTEETDLIATGFDSLSLVALLQFVEKEFGLWLPENEINEANLKNVRAFAAVVARLLHERQPSP